jgi:hypothetical protein
LLLLSSYVVLLELALEWFHLALDRVSLDATCRICDGYGIPGLSRASCGKLGLVVREGRGIPRLGCGARRPGEQRAGCGGMLGEGEGVGPETFELGERPRLDHGEGEQALLVERDGIEARAARLGHRVAGRPLPHASRGEIGRQLRRQAKAARDQLHELGPLDRCRRLGQDLAHDVEGRVAAGGARRVRRIELVVTR